MNYQMVRSIVIYKLIVIINEINFKINKNLVFNTIIYEFLQLKRKNEFSSRHHFLTRLFMICIE